MKKTTYNIYTKENIFHLCCLTKTALRELNLGRSVNFLNH
jgi:hypothetical protein